ncbi:MAG: nucleoside triphosphate pyrophosphohydrolase [Proteobacteria bacterium]|nr:nucleoside triphosphate pyrophosphohydrolase [Pseudomonadota bacterium]
MKKLIEVVAKLRSPEGCSWDRKQTHASLAPYLLEEAWEVVDEIKAGNIDAPLKEELGDVLLQVVLHARIAEEDGRFAFEDVVEAVCEKMINRHPHVFASNGYSLSEKELKRQWNRIKSEEKKNGSILDGIPAAAPALMNALTISRRAASLGFDWETPWDVLSKVEEELEEVRQEMEREDIDKIEEELGDLLFTITNLARFYRINPEIALKKGNDKFADRFVTVEKAIAEAKKKGNELTQKDMEKHWKTTK